MRKQIGQTVLELTQGDITKESVDGIVNAANSGLSGGGGVDGAIHRAGGPAILQECRTIKGGCPTGQAVATGAGNLAAKKVIHAVGPVWWGGRENEEELLASAYRRSLEVAAQEGLRSLAFPSLSTGAYKFPIDKATEIAVKTVEGFCREHPEALELVKFVTFSDRDRKVYEKVLSQLS